MATRMIRRTRVTLPALDEPGRCLSNVTSLAGGWGRLSEFQYTDADLRELDLAETPCRTAASPAPGSSRPGRSSPARPVRMPPRETREETGLTVTPVKSLGERVHPKTGRRMSYTACDVLSGTAHVADAREIAEVAWATHDEIPAYVPYGLFAPVQEYLDTALSS